MIGFETGTAGPRQEPAKQNPTILQVGLGPYTEMVRGEDMALIHCGWVGASGIVYPGSEYDRAVATEKARGVAPLYCHIGRFEVDDSGQLVFRPLNE